MTFIQDPPQLGNQWDDDALLRDVLSRTLEPDTLRAIVDELRYLGGLAGGKLYAQQLADRLNEPRLVQWDPWGRRIDQVEVSPLWRDAELLAVKHGFVAAAYERRHGWQSRMHQFAMVYLVDASLDVYSCPLAMTDGAARTLEVHQNRLLIDRALPHLTSRDPQTAWTSGQWMTERTGGSDVGLSETIARRDGDGRWRLYGTKWFTSAVTAQMALTLARPEGNGAGGRGLALFYLEVRDAAGALNHIQVHRLKDKLGTRKVPTAELALDGTVAEPVIGLDHGVRAISPMLNITRTWNSVGAIAGMRRAIALASDYAKRRAQFGAALAKKPLHVDTLAGLEAERYGALLLTFRAVELLGRSETGEGRGEETLLRLLTPIVKLTTGKQAVHVASEAIECCGGAGYVEDTGLPRLVRDAQVLPIWEGTTNVLSLDTLRALGAADKDSGALAAFESEIERALGGVRESELGACVKATRAAMQHAREWLIGALGRSDRLEAGARRLALTLGRSLELALLCAHAQWCVDKKQDRRALVAARRLLQNGIDQIADAPLDEAHLLLQ